MPKIPDCERCLIYAHNPHLICAVHPIGVDTDHCPDFELDPNSEPEEQWQPEGATYYNGELILQPKQKTTEEQLWLLDNHPLFTGVCPQCRYRFPQTNFHIVHFDCPSCGWVDDSV